MCHWIEPLAGYPIVTRGHKRWLDTSQIALRNILRNPHLNERDKAAARVCAPCLIIDHRGVLINIH
jgi:hypothetical protein